VTATPTAAPTPTATPTTTPTPTVTIQPTAAAQPTTIVTKVPVPKTGSSAVVTGVLTGATILGIGALLIFLSVV